MLKRLTISLHRITKFLASQYVSFQKITILLSEISLVLSLLCRLVDKLLRKIEIRQPQLGHYLIVGFTPAYVQRI